MTLAIVGAGFGRTGTHSLKLAIERLGRGPCYHMFEVVEHPEHAAAWSAAADGEAVDWDALFAGYRATVDWPACHFWRALCERYPQAKVLLTVRDPDRWYDSVSNTIYLAMMREPPEDDRATRARRLMARKIVLEQTFGGRFEDRAHAIGVYERHNETVRRDVAAERLLVHEVAEGWAPLCAFLDCPVPDEPFPRVNTTEEFRGRLLGAR